MKFNYLLFFAVLLTYGSNATGEEVKILNWWEYTPPHLLEDLKNNGFKTNVVTYRTNEMAISRLGHNSEGFDIAVLSNVAIPVLKKADIIDMNSLESLTKRRAYYAWILANNPCTPYFWASTAFTYDAKNIDFKVDSLQSLLRAEQHGYTIAIIDDLFELASRYKIDYGEDLSKAKEKLPFLGKHFFSNVERILQEPKVATYGWHGASAAFFKENKNLKLSAGKGQTVVGFDSVCILNKKNRTKEELSRLVKFVEVFTSKANTEKSMKMTQYFSPYKGHTDGLIDEVKNLYTDVMNTIDQSRPVIIELGEEVDFQATNKVWRKIRYGE